MARTRKEIKSKEPVRLRAKKLANGNQSLYLDIYLNGKRSYEFLKMYIIPEVDNTTKERNNATLIAAKAIVAQKVLEITNNKAGIHNSNKAKILFADWIQYCKEHKSQIDQPKAVLLLKRVERHLQAYGLNNVRIKDVDKQYVLGFIKHLQEAYTPATKTNPKGKPLSDKSIVTYIAGLNMILALAVKREIIDVNPLSKIDANERVKPKPSVREYLTIEELKLAINTPCKNKTVKNAFLFSCFSGLRISDIRGLKWGDIYYDNGIMKVKTIMQKTKELIYLKVTDEAQKWLPQRGNAQDNDLIFTFVKGASKVTKALNKWLEAAGIKKHITFHCARHTFATNALTIGADIATVSKLLGHRDISTTQIYAKIVDKAKDAALDGLSNVFNN